MMKKSTNTDGMSGPPPAVYRIVVEGQLDATWQDRLGAMEIVSREPPARASTVLEGPIRDRAELTGILNTLCDLRMTLVRVEVVEEDP